MDLSKLKAAILDFLSDDEPDPSVPVYDPVHLGAVLVLFVLGIGVLFWLLWSLLVFGGGLPAKVVPALQVLFTARTAADFGYVGYPYEMGVFEGWPTNVIALVFLCGLIGAIAYLFKKAEERPGP